MRRVWLMIVTSLLTGFWPRTSMADSGETVHGLPSRLVNPCDLTLVLDSKRLASNEKSDVLVAWLVEERAHPSPTTKGLGGGQIDSGYIQAQLLRALAEVGDRFSVAFVAQSANAEPSLRDAMHVVLGLKGDANEANNLMRILSSHSEPDLRALAAIALGTIKAGQSIPVLEDALNDSFTRPAGNSFQGLYTSYPVREAAADALRMLQFPAQGEGASQSSPKRGNLTTRPTTTTSCAGHETPGRPNANMKASQSASKKAARLSNCKKPASESERRVPPCAVASVGPSNGSAVASSHGRSIAPPLGGRYGIMSLFAVMILGGFTAFQLPRSLRHKNRSAP